MTVIKDAHAIEELLTRGVVEVIVKEKLREELLSGRKLRIKLGIDPTSPNLHMGRSVPLLKLRDFQELGHQVVFIVGDFTGVIGDTSDKDAERPMLSTNVIEQNQKSYLAQVGKLINLSDVEFRYNSEWLGKLTYGEIGMHADQFSISDFIARDNIKKRIDAGKRVSLREVLYPLMQGYDSVAIHADVELGGTDQRFNMLAGRTLQEYFGQKPQSVVTVGPIVPGLDGRKMSSSLGNTINFLDDPADMYGKVMSMADTQVPVYFELCTRVPMLEVETIRHGLSEGSLHPKEAKMRLAREIVTLYHSKEAAAKAEAAFTATFSEKGVPEDIKSVTVQKGSSLCDILVKEGVVASKTECRRLIDEGAVVDTASNLRIADSKALVEHALTLKVGKRRFIKIEI